MRLWRLLGYALLICALGGGFSRGPRQEGSAAPKQLKGWLDAGPSCVVPIDAVAMPDNSDELAADLSRGARQMALLPQSQQVVTFSGELPRLESLFIDLSNGVEDGSHNPPKIDHTHPIGTLLVTSYGVKAQPLLINGARLFFDLTASDAQLQMRQDGQKKSIVLLTGARQATFTCTVADGDIQSVCSTSAKTLAKKFGFDVRSCTADLTTPNPRQIDVKLHVKLGRPIGGDLTFSAQMDIGQDLTGRVSNITCSGRGPTGILISTLLTPILFLQNGQTRPLLQFPGDRMAAQKVSVTTDALQSNGRPAALHVRVDFGDAAAGGQSESP
ncbi:MAG TPA: hypothetical protein VMD30_09695 [Tepidisphaeraceae bacterium]|nr:hypothetical protein [Tepidisphaeraceae bacterium]